MKKKHSYIKYILLSTQPSSQGLPSTQSNPPSGSSSGSLQLALKVLRLPVVTENLWQFFNLFKHVSFISIVKNPHCSFKYLLLAR